MWSQDLCVCCKLLVCVLIITVLWKWVVQNMLHVYGLSVVWITALIKWQCDYSDIQSNTCWLKFLLCIELPGWCNEDLEIQILKNYQRTWGVVEQTFWQSLKGSCWEKKIFKDHLKYVRTWWMRMQKKYWKCVTGGGWLLTEENEGKNRCV